MTALSLWLQARLKEARDSSRWRSRQTLRARDAVTVTTEDGTRLLNFASNDYLGLATHPQVQKALIAGAEQWGVGSGASHLICGHSAPHQALEEQLAAFTGREAALCFSTGYMANLGIVQALIGRGDAVFEDRLNHASLLDAGLASGARFQRYAHNDVTALRALLEKSDAQEKLVISDGVFSMDGDGAPLTALAALTQEKQAWLMVDDAHGFGVLGAQGRGLIEAENCSNESVPILMATLGKAVGTFGAFVAGSEDLIEHFLQTSRSYRYTTALPPAVAAATSAALEVTQKEPWRREHLHALIARFRAGAERAGLPLMPSQTAIQPLCLGEDARALALSAAMRERGFWITAIRPPTVPEGSARLRITLTAAHNAQQIDALLSALAESFSALEKQT